MIRYILIVLGSVGATILIIHFLKKKQEGKKSNTTENFKKLMVTPQFKAFLTTPQGKELAKTPEFKKFITDFGLETFLNFVS